MSRIYILRKENVKIKKKKISPMSDESVARRLMRVCLGFHFFALVQLSVIFLRKFVMAKLDKIFSFSYAFI